MDSWTGEGFIHLAASDSPFGMALAIASRGICIYSLPVNHWIRLTEGEQFTVRGLFPEEKGCGTSRRAKHLKLAVTPGAAKLLEILPVARAGRVAPLVLPADAPVDQAFYIWGQIPWVEIMFP